MTRAYGNYAQPHMGQQWVYPSYVINVAQSTGCMFAASLLLPFFANMLRNVWLESRFVNSNMCGQRNHDITLLATICAIYNNIV